MQNQKNEGGQMFKVEYKMLYNRDKMNPTPQNRIEKTKEFLSINHTNKLPYFVSIGFVGGECVEDVNASFNVVIYIEGLKARHDLNAYILDCWKGAKVYIFENDSIPTLLQG
tara:strand:- start:416 stop:751 length:336 start_codon:yes stop_codon:yes gene_type:complete